MLWVLNAPLAWLTWIYLFGLAVGVPYAVDFDAHGRGLWWDSMDQIASTLAGLQWLGIARSNRDHVRPAAALIGAGIAVWWASELVWFTCEIAGSTWAQFPSPVSIGFVSFVPIIGIGLVLYIQRAVRHWFTVPLLCDLGVVTAALIVVTGFPINDSMAAAEVDATTRVAAVA